MPLDQKTYLELHKHLNDKIMDTANLFLRSAILINGGAAVAVLGFIASISKADDSFHSVIFRVADAVVLFAFGAAVGVVGIALAYFTNYAAAARLNQHDRPLEKRYLVVKRVLHLSALIASVTTIVLFVLGALSVKSAIHGVVAH